MLLLMAFVMFVFLIAFLVMLISNLISFKFETDANKLAPFECGFKHTSASRPMFSSHFFLVSLLFLVFDVELILLYPVLMSEKNISLLSFYLYLCILLVLTFGTLYEWAQKSLEWVS